MRLSVDEAFRRYGDRVFSAAFSICRNREDADDTVQDTFLKYYTLNEEYMDELEFQEPEDRSLFEAVMRLPGKYRIVIHLFYYEEYSIDEISATLHRSQGTVKSQLSRGR